MIVRQSEYEETRRDLSKILRKYRGTGLTFEDAPDLAGEAGLNEQVAERMLNRRIYDRALKQSNSLAYFKVHSWKIPVIFDIRVPKFFASFSQYISAKVFVDNLRLGEDVREAIRS